MEKLVWEVRYLEPPPAIRYCRHCGGKREYRCSGRFRVNAQRRSLDIWLIYRCSECDNTWNAEVYSRIPPQALEPEELDGFCENAPELVWKYAMEAAFLRCGGAEVGQPCLQVCGSCFSADSDVCLEIRTEYDAGIRVAALVREKLGLSQREYLRLAEEGRLRSVPEQDLRKARLRRGIILLFGEGSSRGSLIQNPIRENRREKTIHKKEGARGKPFF